MSLWSYNTLPVQNVLQTYQKLALLFPAGALGVGVSVGVGYHPDQLPLRTVRLRPHLQRPHHLLPLPFFSILLDETALGNALWLVQHHWWVRGSGWGLHIREHSGEFIHKGGMDTAEVVSSLITSIIVYLFFHLLAFKIVYPFISLYLCWS